jgi:hypothetical protein
MKQCWGDNFYLAPHRFPLRSLFMYMKGMKFIFEQGFRDMKPPDLRYDKCLHDFLAVLSRRIQFEVVIVEYVFWSTALNFFDRSVLKVIDTHNFLLRRCLIYPCDNSNSRTGKRIVL